VVIDNLLVQERTGEGAICRMYRTVSFGNDNIDGTRQNAYLHHGTSKSAECL